MAISDLPILSMLRTRMQWHQDRQRVLAENVANADTPRFRPRDLVPLDLSQQAKSAGAITLARTDTGHVGLPSGSSAHAARAQTATEARPAGNAVSLEDEMMKVAANQMDYQAATALYSRSLGLIKIALGKQQ